MNTITAYPHSVFDDICERNGWTDINVESLDKAFISIISTKDVQEHHLEEDEQHWFKVDHNNVLNLEFDDVDFDIKWDNYIALAISNEQCEKVIDFIEKNKGKDILVHCRAGQSRSVAVARAISDLYVDDWEIENMENYRTPNQCVLRGIKRCFYKKYNMYD